MSPVADQAAGPAPSPGVPRRVRHHQAVLFGPEGRPPYAGRPAELPGYGPSDRQRWWPEPPKSTYRSDFERDRARILHSSALRRLGAKTQVVAPDEDDFARTRLTHSLEVAQVGRELGRSLGCDPDIVDAACLSHDLGHPPFGHNGEKALDLMSEDIGGFEGNAQTLRLLARLETKKFFDDGRSAGLNLTRASLDASCKYPWLREDAPLRTDGRRSRKFGVYADDLPVFEWFRHGVRGIRQSMEAQVMDLADDISYSVHDVEDGIVNGQFQLHWLADPDHRDLVIERTLEWYLPQTDPAEVEAALGRLEGTPVWVRQADGTRRSRAALKDMTSQLIGRFSNAAFDATREVFGNDPLTRHEADVVVPAETEIEIATMKGIAAAYVMSSEARQPLYVRQREILTELVELFWDSGDRYLDPLFAGDWREATDDSARRRVVIDQVASLTDSTAIEWHSTLVRGEPFRRSWV
ncbi:deoxyguanosinetriphosphate triphosphohydrolase [Citricoccus nitrophenolicus]|uniref:deoxyguanosinetriphosphate triphosphohydrolase n=1 Tax=Citricoccus nitrophenolicus TaxID=863575 RepID=UPI003CD0609E